MSNVPKDMPKTTKVSGATSTITPTQGGWAGSNKPGEQKGGKKKAE